MHLLNDNTPAVRGDIIRSSTGQIGVVMAPNSRLGGDALNTVGFATLEEVWPDGSLYLAALGDQGHPKHVEIQERAQILHAGDCERLGHLDIV